MLGSAMVRALAKRLGPRTDERLTAWGRDDLDITDRRAVTSRLALLRPLLVVNAAAFTDVDGAESRPELARAVNATGCAHLAGACAARGAKLVHYSTDFVFDGAKQSPYAPSDATGPLSVYGQSKLDGELAIVRSGCRHLILRTSWLFGAGGRNFVEAILARALRGESLNVVDDQVGRPTMTTDLADATVRCLDAEADGVLHFANDGACSWHEFARDIVAQSGLANEVRAIRSDDLDRPAKRPTYSVLDTGEYTSITGHHPRPWRQALADYLAERGEARRAAPPKR